jgi:hypothetical protein
MPRPRQPLSKLKAMGRDIVNPRRFADRREPITVPLGEPSPHLTDMQATAWRSFQAEIPWLAESDRALLEMVCMIRGRMLAGEEVSVSMINLLRQCLTLLFQQIDIALKNQWFGQNRNFLSVSLTYRQGMAISSSIPSFQTTATYH